ncbi:Zinc finger FYVE/PHD-type protein [Macrophomina phaseolina MS6]|uniref:Zinc finger FYVE/PHD-type protein n=1 Tax=Macrophomina phaseolina (strain MS6) TaxID=1126212 RepID=K2SCH4_MACPH|nr:Zinc finger FYVE/PHD-type protein [Macrophomina phaseolina MS6]
MIVFCDGCNIGYHQYCHHPPIDREVVQVAEKEWFCGSCAASKRKQDEALPSLNTLISGGDLSRDEKRTYFSTLSAAKLTELLLHATDIHPDLSVFAPNVRNLIGATGAVARPVGADATNNATTDGIIAQASQHHHSDQPSLNNSSFLTSHTPTQTINPAKTTSIPPPSTLAISTSASSLPPSATALTNNNNNNHSPMLAPGPEEDSGVGDAEDPYGDGYDSDPPAHYPKPGHGLARTLRPESEDLQWLVDDNLEVFSHVYTSDGQSGLNGFGTDGAIDLAGAEAAAGP